MKVTVLNGINEKAIVYQTLIRQLTEGHHTINCYALQDMEVAGCKGCFGCWLKTPGICVINDAGRSISQEVISSDLLIVLSPVTFGGYSYHIKKVVDRLIPLISPYFMKVDGEFHHRPRYKKYPNLLAIGALPRADKEGSAIFKTLVQRNAINLWSPKWEVCFFVENQPDVEFATQLKSSLAGLEVEQ